MSLKVLFAIPERFMGRGRPPVCRERHGHPKGHASTSGSVLSPSHPFPLSMAVNPARCVRRPPNHQTALCLILSRQSQLPVGQFHAKPAVQKHPPHCLKPRWVAPLALARLGAPPLRDPAGWPVATESPLQRNFGMGWSKVVKSEPTLNMIGTGTPTRTTEMAL